MKIRKLLSVMLMAAMIATLFAMPAMAEDEVITLTGSIFLESIESSSIKHDPVSNYIRDRFGVQFDVICDCAGSTWEERYPALFAADELPDIIKIVSDPATGISGTVRDLVEAGAIVNLDEYPELMADYFADPILAAEADYARNFYGPDGNLWVFPMYFGIADYAKGLLNACALRWDCYDAAGRPEFHNYDELADVLAKMQEVAPLDVNGDKPYAVSGWFADGAGWGDWELLFSFQNMVSANSTAMQWHGESEISDTNYLADRESPYYEYLAFMNKCWRLGILDPDSFTMTWDQYNAEMENGSFLYCSAGWLTDQKNDIICANLNNENAGFVHFPAMEDYKANSSGASWDYGGSTMYAISSKCKNIEKAIEVLAWICSQEGSLIMENGPEGLAWDMVDGVPVGHEDYLKMGQFDSTSYELYGSNLYHHLKGYSDATPLSQFGGVTANLRLSDAAIDLAIKPYEKAALEHFGADSFSGENYFDRAHTTFAMNLVGSCGSVPDDYVMMNANISNYRYNMQFQAIQASTEEEFEAIIADMIEFAKANGAIEIQEYYKEKQYEVKDTLQAISETLLGALE